MTSLTSLTPEMRTALVEAHRGKFLAMERLSIVDVYHLHNMGLIGSVSALTDAGHLVAELLEAPERSTTTVCCKGCPDCQGIGLRESHRALAIELDETRAELLASRTYSPPSEYLPSGWYNVIDDPMAPLEHWRFDGENWYTRQGNGAHPPHRVLGSALPPYSAPEEA